jgi:hypothetical protein
MSPLESDKLFLDHPKGDPTFLPCAHPVTQHPNGDTTYVPCVHSKQAHPQGDRVWTPSGYKNVPCIHRTAEHPEGDPVTVPCIHKVPQHPNGDPGPVLPCTHPARPVREEYNGLLKFYTDNQLIQNGVLEAATRLQNLGVKLITFPRPLHVFHRPPLASGGGGDPLFSHYNPVFHSIQVMDWGQSDAEKLDSLRHEIGHALVGNQLVNTYAGGYHTLTDPASSYQLAMSEGWANFVGLVLTYAQTPTVPVMYKDHNWETIEVAPNGLVEYCVGCCLWDLYDNIREVIVIPGTMLRQEETASIAFTEFFKIYNPSLETIPNGPWIANVWDFLERIKDNNPGNSRLHQQIDRLMTINVGPRPSGV